MKRVQVGLWGTLRTAVGGNPQVEVQANDVAMLLSELATHYPGLRPQIERGVAVSINGVVHNRSQVATIPEGAEVVLLPRIDGG